MGLSSAKAEEGAPEMPESDEDESSADEAFGDAFDALKDGDREGFIAAMKLGKAC